MLSLYEILKASKTGLAPDMWTALTGMNWSGADSGREVKELTGIPPLSFTADGTPLLDYLISGNMSQSGTPTPTTPIQPQETGERTGNLWDEQLERGTLNENASPIGSTYQRCKGDTASQRVRSINVIHTNGVATISFNNTKYNLYVLFFDDDALYTGIHEGWKTDTFTVNSPYIGIVVKPISGRISPDADDFNIMINVGETALPYEPYGYKIPISSANTTTPVYLGEVQTTRKIGKLVLTGNENWVSKGNPATFRYENSPILDDLNSVCYCSHFKNLPWVQVGTTNNSFVVWFTSAENTINIRCEDYSTVEDFKAFLSAQYQNGTPVTIWYVLAEPTTGIVNEPIRKIGDYADTVSMEQAGVQIPTNRGNTVIDVETTLKPSEMYIKYKG